MAWFVIGFALRAFLYAACRTLVNKVTEVSSAVMPIVMVMAAAYVVSILVTTDDPTSGWLASAIYRRGLLITDRRVRVDDVIAGLA